MQHQKARQKYEQEQNNIQGNTLYIQLLCKTILITNKYFNSNGKLKKEKQPLTHYPQGNRTSNYYCKSNPKAKGSQENQPLVPRSSPVRLEFFIWLVLPYHQ